MLEGAACAGKTADEITRNKTAPRHVNFTDLISVSMIATLSQNDCPMEIQCLGVSGKTKRSCHPERSEGPPYFALLNVLPEDTGVLRPKCGLRMTIAEGFFPKV
jgi:hypothetical protein